MAFYLDEPLDDEPLFGVVGRYLERVPGVNASAVLSRLLGWRHLGSFKLGIRTELVSLETQNCWALSAEEIAERLTMYRYYASFVSATRAKKLLDCVTGELRSVQGGLVLWGGRRRRHRYCQSCLSENNRSGEPLHWRRAHQLPGVVFCVRHEEPLWEWEYERPRDAFASPTAMCGKPVEINVTKVQREALLDIAKISSDILNRRVNLDVRDFGKRFTRYFDDRSRYFAGILRAQCAARLLENLFGADYLESHSISLGAGFFRDTQGVGEVSALRIVAASTAVLRVEDDAELIADRKFADLYRYEPPELIRPRKGWMRTNRLPPITCPSKLATHGGCHCIEHWSLIKRHYQGKCSCGMTVIFGEVRDGLPALRVIRWGGLYRQEVRKLAAGGMPRKLIAQSLDMPLTTVKNILRGAGVRAPKSKRDNVRTSIVCPSTVAHHGSGHEIEEIRWLYGRFLGKCSCGLTVACSRASDGTYVFHVTKRGPLYKNEARRLAALGMSRRSIAAKLQVDRSSVDYYLKDDAGLHC
ncbi:TniQ family protein [Paraburkholderia sediminicola]|uniref:TniQ family protein n=1 Tax=Paraburkholderia sediminicola TaxID=458836 RepID=UPI0038B93045